VFVDNSTGECSTVGKRPLGIPGLRWEEGVKRDVEILWPEIDWKELSLDGEIWRPILRRGKNKDRYNVYIQASDEGTVYRPVK